MIKLKEEQSPDLIQEIQKEGKILPFPKNNFQENKGKQKLLLRKRTYAFLIDLYAIVLIKILMTLSYTSFFKAFFFQLPLGKQKAMLQNIQSVDLMLTPIVFFTYFLFSYFAGDGKTIGKLILKLSVASKDLKPNYIPNFKESFMRSFGYCLNYLSLGTLFLVPFFRKDGRGIPDMISKTSVYFDEDIKAFFSNNEENVISIDLSSLPEHSTDEEKKVA